MSEHRFHGGPLGPDPIITGFGMPYRNGGGTMRGHRDDCGGNNECVCGVRPDGIRFAMTAPVSAHVVREGTCSRIRFDVIVPRDVEQSVGIAGMHRLRDALLAHLRTFAMEGVTWEP